MTSIHFMPQIPSSLLMKVSHSKDTKQPTHKGAKSFQNLLNKLKNNDLFISQKNDDRSNGHQQNNGRQSECNISNSCILNQQKEESVESGQQGIGLGRNTFNSDLIKSDINSVSSNGSNIGNLPNDPIAKGIIALPSTPMLSSQLTPTEAQNIRDRLNAANPSLNLLTSEDFTIGDSDGDQKLSEGDEIQITRGMGTIGITLTRGDMLVIDSDPITSKQDFMVNKQKWLDNQPSWYGFTLKNNQGGSVGGSDFLAPVDICVQRYAAGGGGGTHITSAEFSPPTSFTGPIPNVNRQSIEDLFDIIENALNQGPEIPVVIQYNAVSGYPENIHIDYVLGAADDELDYVISNFRRNMV